ncbi:hypothetical protein AB9M75_06715 [Lactobacillus sp. AN1001]
MKLEDKLQKASEEVAKPIISDAIRKLKTHQRNQSSCLRWYMTG